MLLERHRSLPAWAGRSAASSMQCSYGGPVCPRASCCCPSPGSPPPRSRASVSPVRMLRGRRGEVAPQRTGVTPQWSSRTRPGPVRERLPPVLVAHLVVQDGWLAVQRRSFVCFRNSSRASLACRSGSPCSRRGWGLYGGSGCLVKTGPVRRRALKTFRPALQIQRVVRLTAHGCAEVQELIHSHLRGFGDFQSYRSGLARRWGT